MTLTPSVTSAFTVATAVSLAGYNLILRGGDATAGSGSSIEIIAGNGTTDTSRPAGGNISIFAGNATAASGDGGNFVFLAGTGLTDGNGGSISWTAGSGGLTGDGGNFAIQAGAGGTSARNGAITLADGSGDVTFIVNNSANLLSAPLTGNPNFNDPLRLGIAAPTFPTGSTTLTLTNTEYALFCIRPTGAATSGGSPTIVFPNAGLGANGWTKILDLTQVGLRSSLTQLNITCGSVSTAIASATLSAHALFILSFDGTTISFGQA